MQGVGVYVCSSTTMFVGTNFRFRPSESGSFCRVRAFCMDFHFIEGCLKVIGFKVGVRIGFR